MQTRQKGFTLIEILFIAPIVMLVVLTLIGFMVVLTGDALKSRERTGMVYDVQSALDRIEQDVRTSNNFQDRLSAPDPQGPNGSAGTFYDGSNLILEQYATTANPTDEARDLVFQENEPFSCSKKQFNEILPLYTVFFLKDNTLWRRSIMPSLPTCDDSWQRNSCPGGLDLNNQCRAMDEPVLEDVTNFDISYLSSVSAPSTVSDASEAAAVEISLQTTNKVAGDEVTYSGTLRSGLINAIK